jgi:alpha-ribazole phosphatase/probable phosphoglycerate mutase
MNQILTVIDLMRHGEPEGGNKYRGSLDEPLSEQGWAQMRGATAGHCPWQIIVSSPLRRCAEFARELADRHGRALEIEPDLREMSFGAWEGRTAAEIMADTPDALTDFWRDPITHPPPGGESLVGCKARIGAAWEGLSKRYTGQHVLVVSHGGVIRVVLAHILEMPLARIWRLEVPYVNFSRIRIYGSDAMAEPMLASHGASPDGVLNE